MGFKSCPCLSLYLPVCYCIRLDLSVLLCLPLSDTLNFCPFVFSIGLDYLLPSLSELSCLPVLMLSLQRLFCSVHLCVCSCITFRPSVSVCVPKFLYFSSMS